MACDLPLTLYVVFMASMRGLCSMLALVAKRLDGSQSTGLRVGLR